MARIGERAGPRSRYALRGSEEANGDATQRLLLACGRGDVGHRVLVDQLARDGVVDALQLHRCTRHERPAAGIKCQREQRIVMAALVRFKFGIGRSVNVT